MQVLLTPKDKAPHSLHMFTLDFKELKLTNTINNIKRGTKKISNKTLLIKLNKKLNPKIGITIRKSKG